MNFYLYFPYFLTDLDEIRYKISSRNVVELGTFYENRLIESHVLHNDVNENVSHTSYFFFSSTWIKSSTGNIHKN